jgi:hypothetical protein
MSRTERVLWIGAAAAAIYLSVRLLTPILPSGPANLELTGKWHPIDMSCSEFYLSIAPGGMELKRPGSPADRLPVEVEIGGGSDEQKTLLLRLHGEKRPIRVAVTTEVRDDELTFVSADWSAEAHANYPGALNQPPLVGFPQRFLDLVRRIQPLRRCR